MSTQNYTVVISSFDGASDVWDPFFKLLFKYWPDCPVPVYLVAGQKEYNDPRVKTLKILPDKGYASNLLEAFKTIKTPYILYLQEDYYLQNKVDTALIEKMVVNMKEWNTATIRLVPSPKPDQPFDKDGNLGVISPGQPYRVSLQGALWDVEELKKLLKPGESGWDMEKEGTKRSVTSSKLFLSAKSRPLFDYYAPTAIKKGKWMPGALKLCAREGIAVDTSKRKIFSEKRLLIGQLKGQAWAQKLKNVPILGRILKFVLNQVY